jgi:site-specific DNA recombinase
MNLSRESKKGMIEKASQGWFPSKAPYGYINQREVSKSGNGRGRSTVIPDTNHLMIKLVQRIYELRAVENMSYQNILKKVREESLIPTGKTLSKTGIEGILNNKFYGGSFDWQGREYKGKHELIIQKDHFRAVNSKDKKLYTRMPTGLLSGFITCSNAECGCHILYDPKVKKLRSTGEEKTYHYYHCSDGKRVHKENNQKQKNISESKLLDKFKVPVSEIAISEELAKAISKALKKAHEKTLQAHKRNMDGYRVALKETEYEEDKAYDLLTNGTVDQDTYKRQIKIIRDKKSRYIDLLEEGQNFITTKFYETSDRILELANNAESLWNKGTNEEKLNFLKEILSNQKLNSSVETLDQVTIEYDLRKPFKELVKIKKAIPKDGFLTSKQKWCPDADSNHGHRDFQSLALPTELSGHAHVSQKVDLI